MSIRVLLRSGVALAAAALLFLPLLPAHAFDKAGGKLDIDQRDVRLRNSFLDASANDSTLAAAQFPGQTGAALAIWKGIVEWGSRAHGDGSGDPLQGDPLGSGGANFDAFWAGLATEPGSTNSNIVSAISSCDIGIVGFTEVPISNGWRIRFCEAFTFEDDPQGGTTRYDIQAVMTGLYGYALGLGSSDDPGATMYPNINAGETGKRSLAPDDIAGVQCLYGVASATKPILLATEVQAGTLTLHGANFAALGNEVWFTNAVATAGDLDPLVRVSGLASFAGGTRLQLTIPAGAGPGDVLVRKPGTGGAVLSNAFPTDLVNTFELPLTPRLAALVPATVEALLPGTGQSLTLQGTNLDQVTSLRLDGTPVPVARYTLVNATTLTLDLPQVASLGEHLLEVSDGTHGSTLPILVVAPGGPRLELGSGDPGNVVDRDDGLRLRLAGPPGERVDLFGSPSSLPSVNAFVALDLGNQFTELLRGGAFVLPAAGWLELHLPSSALPDPGPGGLLLHAQSLRFGPPPFPTSNLQSIQLVR